MSHLPVFKMIVALCRGGGIGFEGTLPWPKIERDLRFFSQMTRSSLFPYNSAVVMGRKTWESIPEHVQPLPFRDNFVISALNHPDDHVDNDRPRTVSDKPKPGVTFIRNLSEIQNYAMNYDVVWFIGGASIYEQVLTPEYSSSIPIDDIFVTFVDENYEHDTSFPLMYQYSSIEEWQLLRDNHIQRAIWCWTDANSIPSHISFFAEGMRSNNVYRVTDVDRDIVSNITRSADIKAIHERRSPNTFFLQLRRLHEV